MILVVFALNLPYTPTGLPWNDGFDSSVVNYTPFAILLPLIFGVWYLVSRRRTATRDRFARWRRTRSRPGYSLASGRGCAKKWGRWLWRPSTGTSWGSRSWVTSRSLIAGGRESPISRSPSRSSRCLRGASRPTRRGRTSAARSPSRGAGALLSLIILTVAFSMAEVAAAYPTAGGPYWWANDLGGPGWVWALTGGFNLLGLVAIVARRGLVLRPVLRVRLQPLGPRLHPELRRRGLARRDLHRVRGDPLPARDDQHLLVAPRRAVQQHLGVLALRRRARDHRDPDHRPRQPPERGLRLHRADQQLGVLAWACTGTTSCPPACS